MINCVNCVKNSINNFILNVIGEKSMGKYITNKKNMNFKNEQDLLRVQKIIEEADVALKDESRKINDSSMKEILCGTLSVGTGLGVSFSALYFGGITGLSAAGITSAIAAAGALVGGGMVAGLAVITSPILLSGGIGASIASKIKSKKLREAKELVYKNAIAKQNAIIVALKKERDADKERIDYLNSLVILLTAAIKDLGHDLGIV